jgi:hypothetical protein
MIRKLTRKIVFFLAVPIFIKLWMVPIWVMLGLARMTVLLIPFRDIASRLGLNKGTAAIIPLVTPAQRRRALRIGRTIRLGAKYAPWNTNCFSQAIVALIVLRIYAPPNTIFFGLSRETCKDGNLNAHAWTASGPLVVTGGYGFDRFTVVGAFTG